MYSLNRAQIIGNMTRDPEMRTTASGQNVANFGVATSSVWTDAAGQRQEKTEFHNIVVWGKLAEICGQYLHKGKKVFIEGRLQTREWESQDGQKRRTTEIVADSMIMLDRPQGQGGAPTYSAAAASSSAASVPPVDKALDAEQEIKVEDIPF